MELHIYEIFLQLDNPRSMYVQTALLRHYYHMQALQIFALEEARFFHQVGLHDMDAAAVALNSIGNNSIGNYIGSNTTSANAITTSAIASADATTVYFAWVRFTFPSRILRLLFFRGRCGSGRCAGGAGR